MLLISSTAQRVKVIIGYVSEKRLVGSKSKAQPPVTPRRKLDQRPLPNRGVHGKAHQRACPPRLPFLGSVNNLRNIISWFSTNPGRRWGLSHCWCYRPDVPAGTYPWQGLQSGLNYQVGPRI